MDSRSLLRITKAGLGKSLRAQREHSVTGAELAEVITAVEWLLRDAILADDDPVDPTRTTNPDGTRTPHDESATGSPEETVDATLVTADVGDSTVKLRVDHRMFTEGMVVTGARYHIVRDLTWRDNRE